jgi:hypothetical protein
MALGDKSLPAASPAASNVGAERRGFRALRPALFV